MPEAISFQTLSELIGSIYDCAVDPDHWDQTLGELRRAFNGQFAALGLIGRQRILVSKVVGLEPQWHELQAKHAPEINHMLDFYTPSIDEPHVLSRDVPAAYRQTSPYIREFMQPLGIVDVLEYFLIRSPTHNSLFAIARVEREGVVTEREINLGGLLLPHLRRSVTISKVLEARAIERNQMVETLDALKCAVVLTNRSGGILHANRAAERMMRHREGIQSVRGVLQAKAPEAARELRSAIRLAAADETTLGKIGLAIRLVEEGHAPAFAHVLPLARGELRTRLEPEAVAAVFVGGSDEDGGAEDVAAAFGLSPAETRVIKSLIAGRSLKETADELGLAITTAKTYLDNVFQKTGVHRQAELVRLAARAASPARPTVDTIDD